MDEAPHPGDLVLEDSDSAEQAGEYLGLGFGGGGNEEGRGGLEDCV